MDIYGSYFDYAGVSSRVYGLIFANVNTERLTNLTGDIKQNTIFNKADKRAHMVGDSYEDSPIQFEAEVVVDGDHGIPLAYRREIEKWLFRQSGYRKLYIDQSCDIFGETFELVNGIQKRMYLNCRFTNPHKLENNSGIMGYRFTVECDSCMAWQDPVLFEYRTKSGERSISSIVVDVDTDLNDYTYPKITIQIGSAGGNISLVNESDDTGRITAFENLPANSSVTMMGGGINYISEDYYTKFSSRNFVRLLDGTNRISITGDVVSVNVEFQNRRFV